MSEILCKPKKSFSLSRFNLGYPLRVLDGTGRQVKRTLFVIGKGINMLGVAGTTY
jgi:hypothetical protein